MRDQAHNISTKNYYVRLSPIGHYKSPLSTNATNTPMCHLHAFIKKAEAFSALGTRMPHPEVKQIKLFNQFNQLETYMCDVPK